MSHVSVTRLHPPHGDDEGRRRPDPFDPPSAAPAEDLAYRVEVWDETGSFPERLIAITVTASIGYAAFYAAAREYPGRAITLSSNGHVLSRWTDHLH